MASATEIHIDELRQAVTVASLNYEIWWVYKSSDTRPVYVDTMRIYNIFFLTGIHAHFVAMITALYRIFETRNDTYNFKNLLDCLSNEHSSELDDIRVYKDQFENLKPTWIKISRLRNDAFSHRNMSLSIEEIFREVNVTPNEFRDFIKDTKMLLNDISRKFLGNSHVFNTKAKQITIQLLNDLTEHRNNA